MGRVTVLKLVVWCILGWLAVAVPARAEVSVSASASIALEPAPEPIDGTGDQAGVAASGSGWLTVWADSSVVVGRFIDRAGQAGGLPFDISPYERGATGDVSSLKVVFDGTSFVVVWFWSGGVRAQRLSAEGKLLGPPQRLGTGNRVRATVAAGDGRVLVAACESLGDCSLYSSTGGDFELTDTLSNSFSTNHMSLGYAQEVWLLLMDGAYLHIAADGTFVEARPTFLYSVEANSLAALAATTTGFGVLWNKSNGTIRVADVPLVGDATIRTAPLLGGDNSAHNYGSPVLCPISAGYLLVTPFTCAGCSAPGNVRVVELDASLQPLGPEQPLELDIEGGADSSLSLAFDGASALSAYRSSAGRVTVQRLSIGPVSTLGSAASLSLNARAQTNVRAARLGQGWLVVWREDGRSKGAVLDAHGALRREPFEVWSSSEYPLALRGSDAGALLAFSNASETNLLHFDLEGNIDQTVQLEPMARLRLAASSTGWLGLFTDRGRTKLKAQRFDLDGAPLEATDVVSGSDIVFDVVDVGEAYQVYWRIDGAIWSRRARLRGGWFCEPPEQIGSDDSGTSWELMAAVAGPASWVVWNRQHTYDLWSMLLTLPGQTTRKSFPVVRDLARVNSAAIGAFAYESVTISPQSSHVSVSEPDGAFTTLIDWPSSDIAFAESGGKTLLLAASEKARMYGSWVPQIRTSILTFSGGAADVVPEGAPRSNCAPGFGGEGGASGAGGVSSEDGGGAPPSAGAGPGEAGGAGGAPADAPDDRAAGNGGDAADGSERGHGDARGCSCRAAGKGNSAELPLVGLALALAGLRRRRVARQRSE